MIGARTLARASRQGRLAPLLGPALRLSLVRYRIALDGLSHAVRIAVVSDLHFDWGRSKAHFARQVRRRVQATSPDIVVFLGDLAGGFAWQDVHHRVLAGAAALAGFTAPLGCFAILGNHEWKDDPTSRAGTHWPEGAHRALEDAGWHVLRNAAVDLGPLWLAGIGSQRAQRDKAQPGGYRGADDLPLALAPVPAGAPVVLLAHEPDIFTDLPDDVRLTLSGHTHAGQIRLFGRPWVVPSRHGTRFAYGHHRAGARHLVVSGGLGCSGLPLRYGIEPEITIVDLIPA